jgi:hypothetical protein
MGGKNRLGNLSFKHELRTEKYDECEYSWLHNPTKSDGKKTTKDKGFCQRINESLAFLLTAPMNRLK